VDSDLILDRARAGDPSAMESLLNSLAPSIHRFGVRMCRNEHDAEEVLQDTLLTIATHLGEYEGRSSLTSWVFALARSACSRRRRGLKNKQHLQADVAPEPQDDRHTPEEQTSGRELAHAVTVALDGLSEDYREAITLRDLEGLSAPDAAASLGLSVPAFKSRLHRARSALREALRPVLEPVAPASPAGCPDVLDRWSKKLEGDLSSDDCAAMEKHLSGCSFCNATCEALKRALFACQRTRQQVVPESVQARVREAVQAWRATTAQGSP
jgi:RNA polymerase sigma-70 factor, ECF subfamily